MFSRGICAYSRRCGYHKDSVFDILYRTPPVSSSRWHVGSGACERRTSAFSTSAHKRGNAAHPVSSSLRHLKMTDAKFVLTEQDTQEFVVMLTSNERSALASALRSLDQAVERSELEQNVPPTRQQLRAIALYQGLPFIGFGFLDNALMIVAGDFIDTTIGTAFCISTMAAAALGNTVSDVAGIGASGYVEQIACKMIRTPRLTSKQRMRSSVMWSSNLGRVVGIVIGCLLGMAPLLFMSPRPENQKRIKESRVAPEKPIDEGVLVKPT